MKVALSSFYQVRHFKKYMLPLSTAIWDPFWFHDDSIEGIFLDKRGILNGIRITPISDAGASCENIACSKDCQANPDSCQFIKKYKKCLETIDFDKMYKRMLEIASNYQNQYNIKEEIIMVLIVYEAPQNLCSERQSLIEYFNNHGVSCKELKYPIEENYK